MVRTDAFVAAIERHWTTTLRGVATDQLRQIWKELARALTIQIETHNHPQADQWKVLKPETGTGKSQ